MTLVAKQTVHSTCAVARMPRMTICRPPLLMLASQLRALVSSMFELALLLADGAEATYIATHHLI